jgi:hypothetical protein
VNTATQVLTYCVRDNAGNTTKGIYPVITDACFSATNMPTIPNFDTYKDILKAKIQNASLTANQKYGYTFSENTTDANCFRGILANNITTLITNQLNPRPVTELTLDNWTTKLSTIKNTATPTLNTNGYYYYNYTALSPTSNTLNITTSPSSTDTNTKTVVVEGGNIHIKTNLGYLGTGKTLILIARKDSTGKGGNIIIDPTVTNIDALLIADGGALKTTDSSIPAERLRINGRLYSYNTRA